MIKRVLYYLIGIAIACMGVAFIVKSNVGAGPQDIVLLVLAEKTGLTFGTWVMISQAIFLILTAFLLKNRPKYESIISIIIWGLLVDFWMERVFTNLELLTIYDPSLKWSLFLGGILLIGLGVGVYLTSNLPSMPYDGLMIAVSMRFKMSLKASRTLLELIFIFLGICMGGRIGIGTVIIVLLIGVLIQFFHMLAGMLYHHKLNLFSILRLKFIDK
jgi:uncharacterized protein